MKWSTWVAYRVLPPSTWDQIRFGWALSRRRLLNNRRRAARQLAGKRHLKLHLGCGTRAMPGWVNVDAFEQPGLDVRWDLRDPLPCESDIADLVYSEHMLEHLEADEADALLRDIWRVLGPGGRIRLGVPDAALYLRQYAAGNREFFHTLRNIGNPATQLDTPIKVINQMFRMGGAHRFAWDLETLSQRLTVAGFVDIRSWPSGRSSRDDLCLDDPAHAVETLYVEADKPV